MISFNSAYNPPALTVFVNLTGVVHDRPRENVEAIIDTGADISAVPEELSEKLNLYRFGRIQLEDARATIEPAYTYEVQIALNEQSPLPLEVILTPFPFVILGRDWIQNYYFLLKGPEREFIVGRNWPEVSEILGL